MTQTEQYLPVRVAAQKLLQSGDVEILASEQSDRFLNGMLDFLNPSDPISRMFVRNCDEELLSIYAEAAKVNTEEAIEVAARKAMSLLEEDNLVRHEAAEQVSCELAFAVANSIGIECPEWVRLAAVQSFRQQEGSGDKDLSGAFIQLGKLIAVTEAGQQGLDNEQPSRSPESGEVTDVTSGVAINYNALSHEPDKRVEQAEAAGISMSWFKRLRWVCWYAAGYAFVCAGTCLTRLEMLGSFMGDYWGYSASMLVVYIALGVLFVVSERRLSTFLTNAPRDCLLTMAAYMLAEISYIVTSSQFLSMLSISWKLLQLGACFIAWVATYVYFKDSARGGLFSL